MKHLTLIRHAKSDWSDAALNDFDRPLNKRGKKAAPLMGSRIAAAKEVPQLLVSSPAKRARKTAQLIARELAIDQEGIRYHEEIFAAKDTQLVKLIRGFSADLHIALIGHNPGLTDLGQWLCAEAPDWLPTCAVLTLKLDIHKWSELDRGCAEIISYDYPKKAR